MKVRRRHFLIGSALALATLLPVARAVDRSRLAGASKEASLTGDWGGYRTKLAQAGLDFAFSYTAAGYENLNGGSARGGAVEGAAGLDFNFDLAKLAGWPDMTFHVSGAAAHGTSISTHFVQDVNMISSYFLERGLYLNEVWIQKGWRQDQLTLRVGKLDADLEFPLYSYADTIPLPLYPTGALGARLYYEPNAHWFFSAAVYDGDPNHPRTGTNLHGLDGLQLARSEGVTNFLMVGFNHGYEEAAAHPPGTWKVGVYHSTRRYPDNATGVSHRGNSAWFVNGDQTLWRESPRKQDDAQGLALYVVGEYAPPDRNTYHYGFGGGPYYTGLVPHRDQDVVYFNVLYTRFSQAISAASRAAGGPGYGIETRWQLNYQIVINSFFYVTPEINYVVCPGGTGLFPHATVLGLRVNLTL